MKPKWYKSDFTEELCILSVLIIAILAILTMSDESSNIVSTVVGGLIGYLTRSNIKK